MSDVYRIAVKLMVESNAHGVLGALSRELLGVHGQVKGLQESLAGLSRMKLAIGGGLAIAGGLGILTTLDKVAQHGTELLDQEDKLIRAGRTHAEVAALTADAYERIAKAVPTATAADILRATNQLAVVTGDLNAATQAAPMALKIESLLENITGRSAEGSGHSLYRALEMKGLTSGDDANRALGQKLIQTFVQDIAASGGKLTADDYQSMAKRGGAYWKKMSPEFLAGPMSVVAADMGGSTAGTTLATFGQFLTGATQMSKQQMDALSKLGMLDMTKVHKQKNGGFNTDAGAIHGSLDYAGDYFGWMQKALLPAMEAKGIHEGPERDAMMGKIGRNRNTLRMMTMFSDPEFVTQITKDVGVFRKAMGLDAAYDDYTKNDPKGVRKAYDEQEKSMMQAIGAPLMQAAIPVMKSLTTVFTDLGAFANAHGEAIKALGVGLAGVGVALVGGGTVALLAAIGPAGWLIGGLTALGAALTAWKPGAMKDIAAGIRTAWTGLATLDFGKLGAGLAREFKGAIDLLPGEVAGSIRAAIASIAGIFNSAIGAIGSSLSSVKGWINGHLGNPSSGTDNIGALPQAFHGSAPGDGLKAQAISDRVRSNSVPRQSGMTLALTNITNVDGKSVAKTVTKHQVAAMEFPHAIGGHDGYGSYYPAGGTAMPA